jgi:hypothetical protein
MEGSTSTCCLSKSDCQPTGKSYSEEEPKARRRRRRTDTVRPALGIVDMLDPSHRLGRTSKFERADSGAGEEGGEGEVGARGYDCYCSLSAHDHIEH